jgi:hypothetical protein
MPGAPLKKVRVGESWPKKDLVIAKLGVARL